MCYQREILRRDPNNILMNYSLRRCSLGISEAELCVFELPLCWEPSSGWDMYTNCFQYASMSLNGDMQGILVIEVQKYS